MSPKITVIPPAELEKLYLLAIRLLETIILKEPDYLSIIQHNEQPDKKINEYFKTRLLK